MTMRTFCENAKAVNDAADALRRHEMSGRVLLPWDMINTSQRRKWLDKAQVVLDAFKPQPVVTAELDALVMEAQACMGLLEDIPGESLGDRVQRLVVDYIGLRKALEKIQNEAWTKDDLKIRDCKHPEMIWQSVARRALAVTDADGGARG